jgi:hypothetical protein
VLRSAISKSALIAWQQRLNPVSAADLTEDKVVFSNYCRAYGLPAPRLLAVVGWDLGWTADGKVMRCDAHWTRFFDELAVGDIVIKPALGVYGRDVRFYRRAEGHWLDETGRAVASTEIVTALRHNGCFSNFVVQERVPSHPSLARLSGTDYLQTVRIVTLVSERNGPEIVGSLFKVIGSNATIDNFASGSKGNLLAPVSRQTGRIECALTCRPSGVGLEPVERHPLTGLPLPGFQLPFWPETCELARRAALAFAPLLSVGWDVAITPDGPVLIEGNAWWDPQNEDPSMLGFATYLRSLFDESAAPAVGSTGNTAILCHRPPEGE